MGVSRSHSKMFSRHIGYGVNSCVGVVSQYMVFKGEKKKGKYVKMIWQMIASVINMSIRGVRLGWFQRFRRFSELFGNSGDRRWKYVHVNVIRIVNGYMGNVQRGRYYNLLAYFTWFMYVYSVFHFSWRRPLAQLFVNALTQIWVTYEGIRQHLLNIRKVR